MRKAKVVKGKDLKFETGREPPLMNKKGINSSTVENPGLKINRTLVPPGARNQRHYHTNCDAGMHIINGRLKMFLGPDHEMEEVVAEKGDFVFIPAGVIHGLMNVSDTEPAELLAAKNNVGDDSEEGTVFVEPFAH